MISWNEAPRGSDRLEFFRSKTLSDEAIVAALSLRTWAMGYELEWLLLFDSNRQCHWSKQPGFTDPQSGVSDSIRLDLQTLDRFAFIVNSARHPDFSKDRESGSHCYRAQTIYYCSRNSAFQGQIFRSNPYFQDWLESKGLHYVSRLIDIALTL